MRLYKLDGSKNCTSRGGRIIHVGLKTQKGGGAMTESITKPPVVENISNDQIAKKVESLQNKLSKLSTAKIKGKNRFISL